MSGNVVTEDRDTAHGGVMRIMTSQLPSQGEWWSPSICIPVKGLLRWSVCKLQCQMAEDYFHFFPWILHVARIQPTLGENKMTHSLLFWSVQQILCIFICGVFKVNLIELVAMWEEGGYIVPLPAPTPAPISPPPGFTRRISTFAFRPGRRRGERGGGVWPGRYLWFCLKSILCVPGSIHWSSCVGGFKPPAARAERENILGLGGKGGFYLNRSIENLWIMDKGILWKTGKTLNEIQFTMAVIQMQNYWKSFGNQ